MKYNIEQLRLRIHEAQEWRADSEWALNNVPVLLHDVDAELAQLHLSLQAASLFVRDIIEALGQPQPPLDATVDLPAIAMQVVGQIEELKAELARAKETHQ
jgi:hypothetical protein